MTGGEGALSNSPPSPFLDGATLRSALPADAPLVAGLSSSSLSRSSHGLDLLTPEHAEGLLSALGQGMWSTPTLLENAAGSLAFFALTNVDPRDLSADLLMLLPDGSDGDGSSSARTISALRPLTEQALRRYVESVFWAYPLERLACRVLHPLGIYAATLVAAGFVSEGALPAMARRGGERVPVEYFSRLRLLTARAGSA